MSAKKHHKNNDDVHFISFSDTVGRTSVGSSESPSWISVARQKQKNFIEQSPESSPEKLPSQVCAEASYNQQICHVQSCPGS